MKVQLVNAAETGEHIISQLRSHDCMVFRFAVAYARSSGVNMISGDISKLLERQGFAEGFVGVNQGVTSYQGLCILLDILGEDNLHLRFGKALSPSFHPKVYIFGRDAVLLKPSAVMVGSSNLSRGGLNSNEECGCFCEVEPNNEDFSQSINEFWEATTKSGGNFKNMRASSSILSELLEAGALIDEKRKWVRPAANAGDIMEQINAIATSESTPNHSYFLMTLSHFDTSHKSADPVILIPLSARKMDERFWFWPRFFTRGDGKFDEYRTTAEVRLDGRQKNEAIRLYNYVGKSEFRLKSELIKRHGEENDILVVHRKGFSMSLELIRQTDKRYNMYKENLTNEVEGTSTKKYDYWSHLPPISK